MREERGGKSGKEGPASSNPSSNQASDIPATDLPPIGRGGPHGTLKEVKDAVNATVRRRNLTYKRKR